MRPPTELTTAQEGKNCNKLRGERSLKENVECIREHRGEILLKRRRRRKKRYKSVLMEFSFSLAKATQVGTTVGRINFFKQKSSINSDELSSF
jgi:hypothetical protein